MFETFSAILFLVYSLLISRFICLFSCRGKEVGINDGSVWGKGWGGEREREGGSRDFFVKDCLMIKKNSV